VQNKKAAPGGTAFILEKFSVYSAITSKLIVVLISLKRCTLAW
jgi:hypothetical protein